MGHIPGDDVTTLNGMDDVTRPSHKSVSRKETNKMSVLVIFFHHTSSEFFRLSFSSFNLFVPSLPKQKTTVNSFSVVTYPLVTKLNHHLWTHVNAKLFNALREDF